MSFARWLLVPGLCMMTISGLDAEDLEPWASRGHAEDRLCRHVQEITDGQFVYTVFQGGTMDGINCRPPIGYAAWSQPWESNRAVRMENVGETDVVNPWLFNGRNGFRTLEEILSRAIEPGMTDREKAFALYWQQTQQRFHAYTADDEVNDPVKVYNVYGYTLCGNDATCLAGLWKSAGLNVAPCRPIGHSITQVFYDDAWHVLDGDEHCFFLLRDNYTVASEAQVTRDHDLIKRTHTYGILARDDRNLDEFSASLYITDTAPTGDRDCARGHTMNMTLRPGEAITWRWGHLTPVKFHGYEDIKDWGQNAVDKVCNGLWEYRPDLTGEVWKRGAEAVENLGWVDGALRPTAQGGGSVTWRIRSPYVFVGGRLEAEGDGAQFELSWDGKNWQACEADLDGFFPPASPARYEFLLRCTLPDGAALRSIGIIGDLQMAVLTLPGMVVGDNRFVYTDDTQGPRNVRVTHTWVERSLSSPPPAPPGPVFPEDGATVEGTKIVFRWTPPDAPEGHEIADYEFRLSDRPDMRWALSPNFTKLISNTADRGKAQYSLPREGLISPRRVYYWSVRARNRHNLWGPWSKVWTFRANGPAVPEAVGLQLDEATGVYILKWQAHPEGRTPVRYRVYGSDEKGFSVSDEPYAVNVGNQKEKLPTPFPANFVAETADCHLPVIGDGIDLPNANRAYYRVVAIDEKGNRSWSSDYAEAPRPLIVVEGDLNAKIGETFRCPLRCVRSLGDLRCRMINGNSYNAHYWDQEQPQWELESGPEWLSLSGDEPVLAGVPDRVGTHDVVVKATIDGRGATSRLLRIEVSR